MKPSIRRQFALIFIGLMAGTVLLCWLVNTLFLERYYTHTKISVLYDAYKTIGGASQEDVYDTEAFRLQLNAVCSKNDIAICVIDSNSNKKYVSDNGGSQLELRLFGYILGIFNEESEVIEKGEDYCIQKVGTAGNEYVEMYGRFMSGISFIMQTPIESIRESVEVANRFFFYVGCITTVAGGLIIWLVAKRLTKPIVKLNTISERMVHLDFDAKYREHAGNELDLLGEHMNELSASLEKAISELKTANNELQRDIEKKEHIDEMRKEFLSNVSHELKTPLALIQGYAEGLKDGISEDEESRDYYCEVIMDEASKMNNMVQKLLTLNQLEFGNDVVEMERFNITEMLRGCVQSARILSEREDIQVRLLAQEAIYVWADVYKAEEVFMNYFSNALHHCAGERYIEIKPERMADKVRISVFNTGEPIPDIDLPKIWDKFYKVDKARTREYGGSGVGLSIVKAMMEAMNQSFGVENYENGVLFWFELECVK